jgi:glycosyltransferase involved in cell wall biosynthesis
VRVTGVITCRNYGDFVTDAVRSFIRQDYRPRRLVVIDDASSDGSWCAVSGRDDDGDCPVLVLRSEDPLGPSRARNFCVRQARDDTDVYAFLDADDEYMPGKLSRSISLLRSDYGKVGLVYSDERVIDSVRGIEYTRFKPSFSLERLLGGDIVGGDFLITRSALEEAGGFDESMPVGENYDLALRVVRTHALLHVAEPLVVTRLTGRSLRESVTLPEWAHHRSEARRRHG